MISLWLYQCWATGELITQVREQVCQHYPVHVLKILEVCGNRDKGRRDDRGVNHRKQEAAEHADTESVLRLQNVNGACLTVLTT